LRAFFFKAQWSLSGRKSSLYPVGFYRMTTQKAQKREAWKGVHAPRMGYRYAALKVSILVISLVSSLRRNSSSTHKWGLPYSSKSCLVANTAM
jgi:hypothetical protein